MKRIDFVTAIATTMVKSGWPARDVGMYANELADEIARGTSFDDDAAEGSASEEDESNLVKHARAELDRVLGKSEMDAAMREHVLAIVRMFSAEEHSGFSAAYAASLIDRLLRFLPLTPLTGDDDEWVEVDASLFQNKRAGRVFKDGVRAWDLDAVVGVYPDGSRVTNKATVHEEGTIASFPYSVPSRPRYVMLDSDGGIRRTPDGVAMKASVDDAQ